MSRTNYRDALGRATQREELLHIEGGNSADRVMSPALQHCRARLFVGLQITCDRVYFAGSRIGQLR
jgi:hypothetical protein